MDKLTVLGEGAKYDVSCSSSGADRSNIGRIGNAACAGICHTWSADGRCVSLLKILLSNDCTYDCKYCVNRRSADVSRRTFEPRELADLAIEFYKRNYIEGLFLSSAVLVSPDHTAERIYECLWILREEYGFAGYIHAKVIPGTSPEILHRIGLVSDRLSVNIELPSEDSLAQLAPQKKPQSIFGPMRQITDTQAEHRTLSAPGFMGRLGSGMDPIRPPAPASFTAGDIPSVARRGRYKERFAPAGQTTQMIIGATDENDLHIIRTSEALYRRFSMKRVYFSAYIPVASAPELPDMTMSPPLKREHRLYQADWLLRFYGFRADEILSDDAPNLDYELDPKIVWALRRLELFPIEINKASFEELLRIPGVGNTSATRIMRQRREAAVRYDDLKKMGVVLKRAKYFLTCSGRYYGDSELEPYYIREKLTQEARSYAGGGAESLASHTPGLVTPDTVKSQPALVTPAYATSASVAPTSTTSALVTPTLSALASDKRAQNAHIRQLASAPLLDGARIRNCLAGNGSEQISMFEALQL